MFDLGNAELNLLVKKGEQNKYTNDDINIAITNKNDSHSLIVQNIKENSIVLDVGCAGGYVGEFLKKEKNCIMHGIEIDKEAFLIAKNKNVYESLYDFSITNPEDDNYKKFFSNDIKYDYIIFADVLEHLVDPDLIIYNFFKKLKTKGKILISIPNVAHMDISKNLIDRNFNYNTKGLLDNTHIRFFTKNSFLQMINSINDKYKINIEAKIIGKTIVEPSYINLYPNLFNILNKDSELCVLQYIIELNKSKDKVTYNYSNNNFYQEIENQLDEKNVLLNEKSELMKEIDLQKLEINTKKMEEEKLIQEIKELKDQIDILIENQKKLEKINEELKNNYEDIINSNSWKLTKPLRIIRKTLK